MIFNIYKAVFFKHHDTLKMLILKSGYSSYTVEAGSVALQAKREPEFDLY